MRLALALLLACAALSAQAQSWPTKPVRIVVAYPPGGGIDVMARQIAEKLTGMWGQPVVVETKPGANTIVATESVATMVFAPGLFSTTTGWPHMPVSFSAIWRAMTSMPPPGG